MPNKALLYCAGGGIGDSLLATVVARALRSKYGIVDALTLPGHVETLARVPDIDDVFADEGSETAMAQAVRDRNYAAAVVTWATPRTARVPQLAQIPIRVGQARRLYSMRFTHRVNVRSEQGDVTSHWTQILLDYARATGCDTANTIPAFIPQPADTVQANALLEHLGVHTFIILHATNAVATQRGVWPAGGWARLARALQEEFGCAVLLSGSDADRAITAQIAQDSGAVDIAGRLGIGGFGALAQRSVMYVGITTGTMHVAAAAGAPTVGIFPFQTDVPERWAPCGLQTAIVRASYPCRPGERKETCPDYACIEALDVGGIVAAARSLREAA